MNIATALTLSRIILSPIFVVLYLWYPYFSIPKIALPFILLGILIITELTDAFDGYFARKYNQVTDMGKIIDPMADSIYRNTIFLCFTQGFIKIPLLLALVYFYRDFLINTLRVLVGLRGLALAARPSGKIKAIVQAVAIFLIVVIMIPYVFGFISLKDLQSLSIFAISCAALYTLYSAFDYFQAHAKDIKSFIHPRETNEKS